jgi:hypothetical protein
MYMKFIANGVGSESSGAFAVGIGSLDDAGSGWCWVIEAAG